MDLREALQACLDHRREVLVRRSTFRLAEIERRLEILDGFLIAYLNIDKVIRIIREEDEPKPVMMRTFKLTDLQAEVDPEHAAARVAPAGRDRDQGRAQEAVGRAQGPQGAAQGREAAVGQDRRGDPGDQGEVRRARPSSASAAPSSPTRRPRSSMRSRISSSASRSRSCCRTRAGSAPPRAISTTSRRPSSSTRKATRRSSSCTPRRPTRCCCSAPTAASTRWAATGCRARAAMASRCG